MGIILFPLFGFFWLWMVFDFFNSRRFEDNILALVVFFSPLGAVVYFFAFYIPGRASESGTYAQYKRYKQLSAYREEDLTPVDLLDIADYHHGFGNWEKAIAYYRKALPHMPDKHSARISLAECLLKTKRTDEALEEIKNVPYSTPIYGQRAAFMAARCRIAKSEWTEAAAEFENGKATDGSYEDQYLYGITLLNCGRKEDAKKILHRISIHARSSRPDRRWAGKAKSALAKI